MEDKVYTSDEVIEDLIEIARKNEDSE